MIDDDPMSIKMLQALINKTEKLALLGSYDDAEDGVAAIMAEHPDIVFIDVEMPKLSGLEIIRNLPYNPAIIIVSGSPDHAAEAFELDVTDYLVKPIENYARFLKSIEKVRKLINSDKNYDSEKLFLKVDSTIINLAKTDIFYIKALGDYVQLITHHKTYTVKYKLSAIHGKLSSEFVRTHRSFIVNINNIENIEQNSIEINKEFVPIGESYKRALLDRIELL
ncbi:MAG: LytTR family DNA-binding domain-containing protein [Bacteroidota bacterium]